MTAHSALGVATLLRPRLPRAPHHATAALRAVLPHCGSSLAELDLRPSHGSVGDGALEAVAGARSLRVLRLDHCSAITHTGIRMLCSGVLTEMEELSLRSAGDIGDGAPLSAPGAMPSLRRLDLSWCHSVRGDSIALCAARLRQLTLHGCELVDSAVCHGLAALEELDVAFTRVCDVGLMALAAGSPNLRRLVLASRSDNLWTTGNWSEAGLGEFRRLRPDVEVVFATC
ncbi:hypothetical protein HYH02_001735 [Chlamydomonas schloesseri]|uniref:Mitochondrial ATP synthase regulatory component factor B n=1 Tax=Chlamydomonas schloesseri TaxID=2026947 RepID=A0A836BC45_9CHLO|nr:hypothetical protein HYH02_001735 [Chlamydomonas schloesseri]|eukprot:KAG2453515.1 hypothetical protein HYH02_001735 [Chlamydomonas schloesseri]